MSLAVPTEEEVSQALDAIEVQEVRAQLAAQQREAIAKALGKSSGESAWVGASLLLVALVLGWTLLGWLAAVLWRAL